MGLKAIIQNAVLTAFTALDDLPVDVVYQSFSSTDYNETTGVASEIFNVQTNVEALFVEYTEKEIDNINIKKEDRKVLIPSLNLIFTPKINDHVEIPPTEDWHVLDVKIDPAIAMWELQVRRV